MRKFLTLWIALAAIVAVTDAPRAQMTMTGVGGGGAGGVTYQGPGDVVTSGWVYWLYASGEGPRLGRFRKADRAQAGQERNALLH